MRNTAGTGHEAPHDELAAFSGSPRVSGACAPRVPQDLEDNEGGRVARGPCRFAGLCRGPSSEPLRGAGLRRAVERTSGRAGLLTDRPLAQHPGDV